MSMATKTRRSRRSAKEESDWRSFSLSDWESLSPLERLITLPAEIPELTLGWEAALWAESWLIQPNGPWAGQPFTLTKGQLRFLLHWYGVNDDGSWIYHHGVRRLAKGSGKSPFAGVLSLIEFCAPVRLYDFDPDSPGGVVGKSVDMPLVQIAATSKDQTANTMRMVRAFAPKGSLVVDQFLLDPGKTKYYRAPEGTLEVITSSATSAEGAEGSFCVADETEHWKPANGGVELHSTIMDNLAKSGSRMLETSNAWVPGEDTVAEATWDSWVAQEEGRVQSDTKILYDARIAPSRTDIDDEESLRTALEFVYADCPWQNIQPIINRIWSPAAKQNDSQRKYLNRPASSNDAWMTEGSLLSVIDRSRTVDQGEEIAMFFDGSKSNDHTALIGCCIEDGHVFTIGVWEPEKALGEEVDVKAIDLAVKATTERYTVKGFFGDVKEWESFVKVSWVEHFEEAGTLVVDASGGKDPQKIAWDMRAKVFDFTRACELVQAEINRGEFTIDGHPTLIRHILNARTKTNRFGESIGKESPKSPKKIDAAVCMIGARMVRRLVMAADDSQTAKKKQPGRVVGW